MPTYSYLALDERGGERNGRIEASTEREAAERLKLRSYFVVRISEGELDGAKSGLSKLFRGAARESGEAPRSRFSINGLRPVSGRDLVFFFHVVGLMVRSGHTVTQALEAAADLTRSGRLSAAIRRMSLAIQGGSNFANAMAQEKSVFTPLMWNLVGSGETSGQLEATLEQTADNIERSIDLRSRLFAAFSYPSLIMMVTIGVFIFMMMFAVPRIASFFTVRQVALPWMLSALIDISAWFDAYGRDLALGIGLSIFAILAAYTTQRGKAIIDPILLRLPIFGPSISFAEMARLGANFSLLLRSGLTVMEALRVLEGVMTNQSYVNAIRNAGAQILAGRNLSVGLDQKHVPVLLRHLAAIGERSGELEQTMEEAGQFFRKRLDYRVNMMLTWLFPLLMLFVAGLVGFIYVAIFQAVLQASAGAIR